MYPTIVIVLVETQCSMMDIHEISLLNASGLADLMAPDHGARVATLGRPSFAVGPITGTDNEAGSPPSRVVAKQI